MPYITVLVFLLGMSYRFYIWSSLPQPGKMTLFPVPSGNGGTFRAVLQEALLFPGLFKGDRVLWIFAWLFHASLALIIVGHLRVFTGVFDRLFTGWGIDVGKMSAIFGGAAGVVIFAAALLLLIRRTSVKRVKEVSNPTDFLALLLIASIILTGNMMRFGEHFDLNITRSYFSHLITFSFSDIVIPNSGIFLLHLMLVQLLVIFIPFSKILHFGGIFFTQIAIKKS